MIWFVLVYLSIHTCNIRHINYRLQFLYYITAYNIWTSTQYNILSNDAKFKDQSEVESVTISRIMCIYINIRKS